MGPNAFAWVVFAWLILPPFGAFVAMWAIEAWRRR